MFVEKLVIAAILVASAYAQGSSTETSSGPLPTSSFSPCFLSCTSNYTVCSSFTNLSCVCGDSQDWIDAFFCIMDNCTIGDDQAAESITNSLCDSSSSTWSTLAGVTTATFPMSSRLPAATSSSSTITGSSGRGGAAALSAALATGGAILLGIVGGGLLVF